MKPRIQSKIRLVHWNLLSKVVSMTAAWNKVIKNIFYSLSVRFNNYWMPEQGRPLTWEQHNPAELCTCSIPHRARWPSTTLGGLHLWPQSVLPALHSTRPHHQHPTPGGEWPCLSGPHTSVWTACRWWTSGPLMTPKGTAGHELMLNFTWKEQPALV